MNHTRRIMCNVVFVLLAFMVFSRPTRATVTVGWLPIPPEDLALKDNPKQPGADAMILYRENVVDARKATSTGDTVEEYIRMKIFTQAGTKYGHVEVPFASGEETVSLVIGRTIRPDGTILKFDGQVLDTTVEKNSGFKLVVKTFTLPDVQPGSIIEYKYQLEGKAGFVHDRGWILSREIYTREAQFTYIPNDNIGGSGLTPRYRPHLLPPGAEMKQQVDGSYTMVVHDIPGVEQETLMPPEDSIEARVEFFYDGGSDAPTQGDPTLKFWNNYGKKWNGELEHFIDKKSVLSAEVAKTVKPDDTPEVKLRKLYARVLLIRNLNMEDYKTLKETKDENLKPAANVEEVLSRGYANGRQINFLMVGLARAAGFDATEQYVQPRSLDITFAPDLKEASMLQADVVWVKAGTQEYYLDPGARFYPFGLLPWYETEVAGIRVSKNGGEIVLTQKEDPADAILVRNADLNVADDGAITGTLQVDFAKQYGATLREEQRKEDETGRSKNIEDEVKEWLPTGSSFEVTKVTDWDDVEKPVHVEGTLKMPSLASGALQRMLMPRDVFQGAQAGWFTTAKRVNVIYFHYPFQEIDDLKFHVPAGYKAGTVAPVPKIDLGGAMYEISVATLPDGVEVKRRLALNGYLFPKDVYPTLRSFFGAVRTYDNAQMVLQNASVSASSRPN